MLVYEVTTKRGSRLYSSYKGACSAIDDDIHDINGNIISDTRDEKLESGTVLVEYDGWTNIVCKEIYKLRFVHVYD